MNVLVKGLNGSSDAKKIYEFDQVIKKGERERQIESAREIESGREIKKLRDRERLRVGEEERN